MRAKHTLGPWLIYPQLSSENRCRESHRGWHLLAVSESPRNVPIGVVLPMCDNFGDPSEEGQANAHLIVAAPDLLAALKALLKVSRGPGIQDVDAWKRDKHRAEQAAHNAILAAESTCEEIP